MSGQLSIIANTDANGISTVTPFSPTAFSPGFGTFFQQLQFTATAGSVTATLWETNGLAADSFGNPAVTVDFSQVPLGSTLSGTAGSSTDAFSLRVLGGGTPIANVSVRLINADGTSGPSTSTPSAYCQTGAGADPYSVLTDSTGVAVCTPVFGPVAGQSSFTLEIGGVPAGLWGVPGTKANSVFNPGAVVYNPNTPQPLPEYQDSGVINISVSPVVLGSLTAVAGNNQTANPGQALPTALVATLKDTSGHPVAGQAVSWTASPASSVTFLSQTTTTDANGQVSATVSFTATASGQVTIKAASVTNSGIAATFTENAIQPVVVSTLTKLSGDAQSAVVGSSFGQPLQVQVAVSSGSAVNVPVTFAITGPGALSATTANTNANGVAQVTVVAGNTPGNVVVAATVGSLSVTFNLTVVPQGPTVTASNFVNGADLQRGSISPCSLATIAANGIAPALGGTISGSIVGPYPAQLGNIRVTFNNNDSAGIASVGPNAITFQVPCDVSAGSNVPVAVNVNGLTTTVNVTVLPASPGVFTSVQSDGVARAVLVRADGSFVTLANPAHRGDTVTAFVTGLGVVSPAVGSNALPMPGTSGYTSGTPAVASGQVIVGVNNAGTLVTSAQLSPDRQGVFMVSFQIPTNAPLDNNVVFSVAVIPAGSSTAYYSAGTVIPIQ